MTRRSGSAAAAAAVAVGGVAAACLLLMAGGIGRPAGRAELLRAPVQYPEQQLAGSEGQAQMLGPRAASYVRRWSEQAEAAAQSPKEQILALKAQGVPIIFPSKVTDASGNLQKMVSTHAQTRRAQRATVRCATGHSRVPATPLCGTRMRASRAGAPLNRGPVPVLSPLRPVPLSSRPVQAPGAGSDAEAGLPGGACIAVLEACVQVRDVQTAGGLSAGVHGVQVRGGRGRRRGAQGGCVHDWPHQGLR